jgi:protein dithiol oxidoreductase (disulfide-forming)
MKRREFTLALGTVSLLARTARAADKPVEGKDYTLVKPPMPSPAGGKIEVVEFFGYWCPHCNAFEPLLEAWAAKLPADVVLRRVPVGWQAMHVSYQRLYYALEAMGQVPAIQRKVFHAIHEQDLRIVGDDDIAPFAAAIGVDAAKLTAAMKSAAVAAKVKMANQLFKEAGAEGVPTLVIGGRYLTTPGKAGSQERVLQIADALIAEVRANR